MKELKSNELRLGNWVQHEPHESELWEIDITLLESIDNSTLFVVGIPLTPEILEKASKSQEWYHDGLRIYKFGCFFGYCQGKEPWIAEGLNHGKSFDHIIYLHQLQNLYYALTGQELTISL